METLTSKLRPYVNRDLDRAREAVRQDDLSTAWSALERAHILSQPSPTLHTRVHWEMLRLGLRTHDPIEILGQIVRVAVGGLGSALGRFPAGNTGRARVPIFAPMPVPPDVAAIFDEIGICIDGVTVFGRV